MTTKPLFEHETCTRCGGTGNFSFNLMHGTRCYGCGGSGYKLTKRGAAAQKHLDDLRSRPLSEVRVGDLVWFDGFTFKCCSEVTRVEPDALNPCRIEIEATRAKTGERLLFTGFPNSPVKFGFTTEQQVEMREKALAFQATLTKSGTVRKTRV